MGVYIVSTCTSNPKKSILNLNHCAILLSADSAAEAEGLALQHLRKLKPLSEGWCNYDAVASESTKEYLLSLTKFARSEFEIKK